MGLTHKGMCKEGLLAVLWRSCCISTSSQDASKYWNWFTSNILTHLFPRLNSAGHDEIQNEHLCLFHWNCICVIYLGQLTLESASSLPCTVFSFACILQLRFLFNNLFIFSQQKLPIATHRKQEYIVLDEQGISATRFCPGQKQLQCLEIICC